MENRPRRTFRAGSVRASIWDNEVVLASGEKTNMPKVCVERRYKNDQGEWVSSNHFSINELAKLQTVVRAAFDYLVLVDQENDHEQTLTTRQSELAAES